MPVNDKKKAYAVRLVEYIETYQSAFVVECDNVGSKQMQNIRIALRGKAAVIMGKNTTIRKVMKDFLKKNEGHPIAALMEHIAGNIGLIFTNAEMTKVRDIVASYKVPAPARVAAVAPVDVFVEPGPTGCDPGQTAWFQALNIPTKINKGQIEMISRVHLVQAGNKVTDSQAALLQKLNIRPFSYGLKLTKVYQNGSVFDVAVLDIDDKALIEKFMSGVSVLAAASLELGYPTKASIVHSVNDAYKTLIAVALGTDYSFEKADTFKNFLEALASGKIAIASGPATGGAASASASAKVEEKEEEEEEEVGGAGGLFGGGDDDW